MSLKTLQTRLQRNVNVKNQANRRQQKPRWTNKIIDITINDENEYLAHKERVKTEATESNSVELFEKINDNNIISFVVYETRHYPSQNIDHNFYCYKQ